LQQIPSPETKKNIQLKTITISVHKHDLAFTHLINNFLYFVLICLPLKRSVEVQVNTACQKSRDMEHRSSTVEIITVQLFCFRWKFWRDSWRIRRQWDRWKSTRIHGSNCHN